MGGPAMDPAGLEARGLDMANSLVRSLRNARDAFEQNVPISLALDEAFDPGHPESEPHPEREPAPRASTSEGAGEGAGQKEVRSFCM